MSTTISLPAHWREALTANSGALTLKQVAPLLGISYLSARKMAVSGVLHAVDVSVSAKRAEWRVFESSLVQFLEKRIHLPTEVEPLGDQEKPVQDA